MHVVSQKFNIHLRCERVGCHNFLTAKSLKVLAMKRYCSAPCKNAVKFGRKSAEYAALGLNTRGQPSVIERKSNTKVRHFARDAVDLSVGCYQQLDKLPEKRMRIVVNEWKRINYWAATPRTDRKTIIPWTQGPLESDPPKTKDRHAKRRHWQDYFSLESGSLKVRSLVNAFAD
jgi:hypothetical protein